MTITKASYRTNTSEGENDNDKNTKIHSKMSMLQTSCTSGLNAPSLVSLLGFDGRRRAIRRACGAIGAAARLGLFVFAILRLLLRLLLAAVLLVAAWQHGVRRNAGHKGANVLAVLDVRVLAAGLLATAGRCLLVVVAIAAGGGGGSTVVGAECGQAVEQVALLHAQTLGDRREACERRGQAIDLE